MACPIAAARQRVRTTAVRPMDMRAAAIAIQITAAAAVATAEAAKLTRGIPKVQHPPPDRPVRRGSKFRSALTGGNL